MYKKSINIHIKKNQCKYLVGGSRYLNFQATGGIGFYPIVGWEEKKVVKTSVKK